MKKTILILMALMLIVVSSLAYAESEEDHNFLSIEGPGGASYDLFVITKLNYGEDHKVVSVTGHFERVVIGEEGEEESDTAPDSEVTYPLAADFSAYMVGSVSDMGDYVKVTDLYEWYIDSYIGRDNYDGHELVFSCDQTPEEQEMGTSDFWFVTTKIELNEEGEIKYMQYECVVWA